MMRLTFTDYDAFAESIQEASMTMRLTAVEDRKWTLQFATAGAVRLQQGYEGGGSIAEGTTVSDGWVFYHQTLPVHANGQVCKRDEIFVAPPNSEFCLACQPRHEWLTVVIPTDLLLEPSHEYSSNWLGSPHVLKTSPADNRRFTSLVRRFLVYAESKPQLLESAVALEAFQAELLCDARELFTTCQHATSRSFAKWYGQTQTTAALALRQPDQLQTISELAREVGIPERTLRTAFCQCYGISPVEFLRIVRLHQARQLLLAKCPDATTVTQIAFGLGFWDLGRFAGAYRQLFNELPSETLRKPAPST